MPPHEDHLPPHPDLRPPRPGRPGVGGHPRVRGHRGVRQPFRLHDSERGTVRIKVRRSTRFERIDGFSGLRRGQRNIEATVRRVDGRWVALEVERSGGGGEHGGDDD
jgi:hypothetical protein